MTIFPASRWIAREQNFRIIFISWETTTMVFPASIKSWIFRADFFWNDSSPTARTSSTIRTSGSAETAIEKPRRTFIPEE